MKEKEEERLKVLKEQENLLRIRGFNTICGIDEAGRGPLAGPVVVASVIMPADSMIEGINDSKKISEKKKIFLIDYSGSYKYIKCNKKRINNVIKRIDSKT